MVPKRAAAGKAGQAPACGPGGIEFRSLGPGRRSIDLGRDLELALGCQPVAKLNLAGLINLAIRLRRQAGPFPAFASIQFQLGKQTDAALKFCGK